MFRFKHEAIVVPTVVADPNPVATGTPPAVDTNKLQAILAEHKKWLANAGDKRADLSGADLRNADLSRANLSSANLSRANLCGADLRGARLFMADRSSANLSGANLVGPDLRGA